MNGSTTIDGRSRGADEESAPPALAMRGIVKDFPGGRVLHGVDLVVRAGEIHALVGENGAGKSTLMKILAGVHPDHGGEIEIDGRQVSMRTPAEALDAGVAVIYQEFALAPDLTVAENIALGREHCVAGTLRRAATRERSSAEARAAGIALPMDKPVRGLSVAEQQRTEIVKAVARKARILVMDEPTARLGSAEREQLFELMRRLAGDGVAIVYISHFLEEIFAVASGVTVLRDGRRVASVVVEDTDVSSLARTMVGEKLSRMEERRSSVAGRPASDRDQPPAMRAESVDVPGSVHGASLELARGEIIGIAGLDGSGRSAFARALVGAAPGARGTLETSAWRGELPRDPRQAARAGVVLVPADRKRDGILEIRPVSDNLVVSGLRAGLGAGPLVRTRTRAARVRELIERFQISPRDPDRMMKLLSGGNQQKVLLARAVAAGGTVLVLDQPTAGVDIGAKAEIYAQVEGLTEAGLAVLVVSDDLDELLILCHRVAIMRGGRLEAPRPVAELDRSELLAQMTVSRPLRPGAGASS